MIKYSFINNKKGSLLILRTMSYKQMKDENVRKVQRIPK